MAGARRPSSVGSHGRTGYLDAVFCHGRNQAIRGSTCRHPEPAPSKTGWYPELCLEQVLCFKRQQEGGQGQHVLEQFLPRLHTLQFVVPPQHPEPAFRPLDPELCLEGLDGRLSVRHERRLIAVQEAAPSPVFLRNGHGCASPVPVPASGAHGLGERRTATLKPLDAWIENEKDPVDKNNGLTAAGNPKATSPHKPTFLQRERWKAIQKARRKGMSLQAIERELGLHRSTITKYLRAEGPARSSSATLTT